MAAQKAMDSHLALTTIEQALHHLPCRLIPLEELLACAFNVPFVELGLQGRVVEVAPAHVVREADQSGLLFVRERYLEDEDANRETDEPTGREAEEEHVEAEVSEEDLEHEESTETEKKAESSGAKPKGKVQGLR